MKLTEKINSKLNEKDDAMIRHANAQIAKINQSIHDLEQKAAKIQAKKKIEGDDKKYASYENQLEKIYAEQAKLRKEREAIADKKRKAKK